MFVILFSAGTTLLMQTGRALMFNKKSSEYAVKLPGADAEERSEEDKSVLEEDDETFQTEHFWSSRELATEINKHFIYQSVIFNSLERKVVVPPPKA